MIDPLMAVKWFPELLRVRTATVVADPDAPAAAPGAKEGGDAKPDSGKPAAGKAPEAKAADAKEAKEAKKEESLGRVRGLELPNSLEKPVLVYFHWPHEDGERGRRIVKFCSGPLDDEAFVRVSPLFHCIEVNTRDSEAKLVEESGVKATPTLLVCRPDGTIVWRTEETAIDGKSLAMVLRKALKDRFAETWAGIEKAMAAQKEDIAEARKLLSANKTEDALGALYRVIGSDVHFTDEWAEAVKVAREMEKKAADSKAK